MTEPQMKTVSNESLALGRRLRDDINSTLDKVDFMVSFDAIQFALVDLMSSALCATADKVLEIGASSPTTEDMATKLGDGLKKALQESTEAKMKHKEKVKGYN